MTKFLVILALLSSAFAQTTYHVRTDGGTRSIYNGTDYCLGTSNAAASGHSTTDHACAFDHPYRLMNTVTTTLYSAGDTIIFELNGSGQPGVYQIGCWDGTQVSQAAIDLFGAACNTGGAGNQETGFYVQSTTTIKGADQANGCHANLMPELWGSGAIQRVLNLHGFSATGWADTANLGASDVTLQCLNITDHAACGYGEQYNNCADQFKPVGKIGIQGNFVTNLTVTNVWVHGMGSTGVSVGPVNGETTTNFVLSGNAGCGWDFDGGKATTNEGTINWENFIVAFNGLYETYPPVTLSSATFTSQIGDSFPWNLPSGDSSDNGCGDGVGFTHTGGTAIFDLGWVYANDQDGIDTLYFDQQNAAVTETRIKAWGNFGNQLKGSGAFQIANNIVINNCDWLSTQIAGLHGQVCRAGGGIALVATKGVQSYFAFNTVTNIPVAQGDGTVQVACRGIADGAWANCSTDDNPLANITFKNNIWYGFASKKPIGWTGSGTTIGTNPCTHAFCQPTVVDDHNYYFQSPSAPNCPWITATTGGAITSTNYLGCTGTDPNLTNEVNSNLFDARPLITSTAIGAGIAYGSITTDYFGNARPNPPAMGALEFGSAPAGYFIFGGVKFSGAVIH